MVSRVEDLAVTLPIDRERFWTYDDYRQLPDDGQRYEVIHGRLYVTPAPRTFHQTVSRRLQDLLYELERQGKGYVFDAPVEVLMPGATPVQPDLIYLTREQREMIAEKAIEGAPHLVVEILSPSTASRDRTLKLNVYAKAGVPNYWILDPAAHTLEVFELTDSGYRVAAALGGDETFEAHSVEGLVVKLPELFAPL